jgi:predicted HTH domain antitoxin
MEYAAVESYRVGRLSHRQVGQLLGLDYWQTENFLRERNVLLNYSDADSGADCAALDKILGQS